MRLMYEAVLVVETIGNLGVQTPGLGIQRKSTMSTDLGPERVEEVGMLGIYPSDSQIDRRHDQASRHQAVSADFAGRSLRETYVKCAQIT